MQPTQAPPTLQSAFARTKSGVVRFEVATCDGDFIGSGFAISPHLVVTVQHVVNDASKIRVIHGTTSTSAHVIGADPGTDVALVQTDAALPGYFFTFAGKPPAIGEHIAAIGFPEGDPLTFDPGNVNGLDRKAVIEGTARHGLVEMDAATHPGSSGGPVIRADGSVIGLVDAGPDLAQGSRLAVSSATATSLIDDWSRAPQPVPVARCAGLHDYYGAALPWFFTTADEAQAYTTLQIYVAAIDFGDFPTALAQLARPGSLGSFRSAVASSQDSDLNAVQVSRDGNDIVIWATFISHQDPGSGPAERPQETCTLWSLDYTFVQRNGLWLIASSHGHPGVPANQPCPATPTPSPS
jgi:hypothetical protein